MDEDITKAFQTKCKTYFGGPKMIHWKKQIFIDLVKNKDQTFSDFFLDPLPLLELIQMCQDIVAIML